jgi:transcriptional regulator with XRE-family HTH domain
MRRLGYSANAPYLWEAGRRFPPAQVLFELGALNKLPTARFLEFAGLAEDSLPRGLAWSARDTGAWLSKLLGETPATEIARALQSDRTTVSRWLHGATEPRVPDLLKLVDRMTHRLVELVELFVSAQQLPSLRGLATALAAQRRIAYELPWTHAVLRALELAEYRGSTRHVPGVIARAIGTSVDDEARLLDELHAARLIRRHAGKWLPARVLTVDTRAHPEDDRRLKLHWAQVGVERLQARPIRADAFYSFNLCAVSGVDYERIRELHLDYYERVRRIVAESSVAERVVLLNQQLIPLDAETRLASTHPSKTQ